MAQQHGNNTKVLLYSATGGASIDASGDLNSATFRWDRNNPDVTTFNATGVTALTTERLAGLKDYTLDFAGVLNTGGSSIEDFLTTEFAASTYTRFIVAMAGSISGSPIYTGCSVLSTYNVTGPLNGPVAVSFTLQAGAGSLTRSTVA